MGDEDLSKFRGMKADLRVIGEPAYGSGEYDG